MEGLFILGIVLIGCATGTINNWIRTRRVEIEARAQREPPELLADLAQIEKRIAVLERIVTDSRHDLHRQFDEIDDRFEVRR